MSYSEQLQRVKEAKLVHESIGSRWQGDYNHPMAIRERTHRKMISEYYDREIDRLTELAIQEKITEKLDNIDFNVMLNGQKLTDAIAREIVADFKTK